MRGAADEPVVVVSADTHVGPRLTEDLRPYCPSHHLDAFDAFSQQVRDLPNLAGRRPHPNFTTAGHHDPIARLADYDYDGVAAGVIFHGSQNGQPLPFIAPPSSSVPFDRELAAVGQQIFNRWLADFVAQSPGRHVGLAHLPMWDVDAAVAEAERAHDAGLRAVNFPSVREGLILEYNAPVWERFWSVCAERQLPLVTHVGGGSNARYDGPEGIMISTMEAGGWMARRAIWWLIFAGVFERHPELSLVITETPGSWWSSTATELDSIYDMTARYGREVMPELFEAKLPRHPSEYMATNVFFGASFTSAFEARQAIENGVASQLMWGSDYPHVEGTFVNPEGRDMPSVTRLSMRNTFSEIDETHARAMLGGNAMRVFRLDPGALVSVAERIGAPTWSELSRPIDAVPAGASPMAFRSEGIWT